jgi:hypothetical protein
MEEAATRITPFQLWMHFAPKLASVQRANHNGQSGTFSGSCDARMRARAIWVRHQRRTPNLEGVKVAVEPLQ